MHNIEVIVALMLVSALVAGLARAIGVHYAIVLVLAGLALGFIPGAPSPRVQPNLVLFVFLPPLIYAAAFGSSTQDLRQHARPIGILAVGLVLATMFGVAGVIHLSAGVGWGSAMVLGAILAPTDPVAATAVLRRLGAPERISTILEGEAIVNDGTGLTVYTIAVAALASGHFSLLHGVGRFFEISAGGVAIGLVVGWLSGEVRRRIGEPQIEVSISLLTAYVSYIPAQRLGLSGVLAAAAAGLYASRRADAVLSPSSRLRMLGFWEVLTFLLESLLFLLIGLQLKRIVGGLHSPVQTPLLYAGAVIGGLVAIRMAWMFVVGPVAALLDRRGGGEEREATAAELLVMGWSGMRGGLSLAAALALPFAVSGHPFAERPMLLFVSYIAIAVTIVIPGLTVMPLVRLLGIGEQEAVARAEAAARRQLAHAALRHIEEVAEREPVHERVLEQLRATYELRIQRLEPQGDGARGPGAEAQLAQQTRRLRRELIGIERQRLLELRRAREISLRAQRRIERDLDLEESRLAG